MFGHGAVFETDPRGSSRHRPFPTGDSACEITEPLPNLTRAVAEGETARWLAIRVDPTGAQRFAWERRQVAP